MVKKITIQHLYTTSGTTAPTGLTNGEIAISHTPENEAIFLKPRQEAGKTLEEIKFIPEVRIRKMFEEAGIGSNDVITGLSNQLSAHIETSGDKGIFGHVQLVSGNVQNVTEYTVGQAAASYHTHGQYLDGNSLNTTKGFDMMPGLNGGPNSYGVRAGTGITVDTNGVSINDEYQGKIASGVTAYGWGNHADEDYAKNDDLTAHTDDKIVHITNNEREKWDNTTNRLKLFLDESGTTQSTLDSIIEFQKWFETHGTSASTMQTAITKNAADISTISGVVAGHTTAITQNNNNISSLVTSASTNATNIQSLGQTIGQVSTNVTAINDKIGSGFTSDNTIASEIKNLKDVQSNYITNISGDNKNIQIIKDDETNSYTITHTGATGEDASKVLTGTTATALTWGGTFTIPTKISHDTNGHYVSGTTTTFTMPTLPAGTNETPGIVKVSDTIYENTDGEKLLHGNYLTASAYHIHNQYVKFTDLEEYGGTTPLVISCGTY